MVSRGRLARAVGSAIAAQKTDKLDDGTVALARTYAELIDDAAPAAKYTKSIDALRLAVDELGRSGADVDIERIEAALDVVIVALSAHSVASDLGPKLLAALTALGMTPAARKAAIGGTDGPKPRAGRTDELRERRQSRAARAR